MPKGIEKPKDPIRKKPRLTLKERRRARRAAREPQATAGRGVVDRA